MVTAHPQCKSCTWCRTQPQPHYRSIIISNSSSNSICSRGIPGRHHLTGTLVRTLVAHLLLPATLVRATLVRTLVAHLLLQATLVDHLPLPATLVDHHRATLRLVDHLRRTLVEATLVGATQAPAVHLALPRPIPAPHPSKRLHRTMPEGWVGPLRLPLVGMRTLVPPQASDTLRKRTFDDTRGDLVCTRSYPFVDEQTRTAPSADD
jgi:hypothetical protein